MDSAPRCGDPDRHGWSPRSRWPAAREAGIARRPSPGDDSRDGGGFTPGQLARVYGFNPAEGGPQTVAVVDAYDAPTVEADLKTFSEEYGLPECTAAEDWASARSPAPARRVNCRGPHWRRLVGGGEPRCRDGAFGLPKAPHPLVEAETAAVVNLAAATRTAAAMGVQEISNSYGAHELGQVGSVKPPLTTIPGGDRQPLATTGGTAGRTNPAVNRRSLASAPTVVGVGGTTLELNPTATAPASGGNSRGKGERGGCSTVPNRLAAAVCAGLWRRPAATNA